MTNMLKHRHGGSQETLPPRDQQDGSSACWKVETVLLKEFCTGAPLLPPCLDRFTCSGHLIVEDQEANDAGEGEVTLFRILRFCKLQLPFLERSHMCTKHFRERMMMITTMFMVHDSNGTEDLDEAQLLGYHHRREMTDKLSIKISVEIGDLR